MKVSGIMSAALIFISLSFPSMALEKGYKKVLGMWEFSAPKAPQRYEKGILTIKEVDKKLFGEFTVQGQALSIPKVEYGKKTLTLNFEVENTAIVLKLKLVNGLLEGETNTPDGLVTVTAKPTGKKTK
jgi:hypothetical protein